MSVRSHMTTPGVPQDMLLFAGNSEGLPVVLVGMSMGAGIVTEFAAKFPHKVDGLVLLSPAGPQIKPTVTARVTMLPFVGDVAMHLMARKWTGHYDRKLFTKV